MFEVKVDPNDEFNKSVNEALKKISDLTIPFQLMAREWFKGNISIFDRTRQGPGQYQDLSPKYKALKTKLIGSPYPILRGFIQPRGGGKAVKSGKLARSMTDARDPDAVNSIINRNTLILGTKTTSKSGAPYPVYLHRGTRKMPARPFVLIGGEQVATREINQRKENWIMLLNDYVLQVTKKKIG